MNSKLGEYWFNLNGKKRGVGVDIGVKVFRLFPLPKKTNKDFRKLSDEILKAEMQLTELYKTINNTTLQSSIKQTERQITHFENKINELVYQLYDLSEEEKLLIENN
jgi:adenine-specific DNA-methyltransferase